MSIDLDMQAGTGRQLMWGMTVAYQNVRRQQTLKNNVTCREGEEGGREGQKLYKTVSVT
jgi:hypothetical protein